MRLANEILHGTRAGVEHLLDAGEDINEIDPYGFTPLIETVIAHKIDIAELLINREALIDEPDLTGRTPLHWAVYNNDLPFAELLLKHGANPNAFTDASQPILVMPLLRNQQALKELLYKYGADLSFAQDYVNAKLIGHRYELVGKVDIYNSKGRFVELDFEGFFLEFTLSIIEHSLQRYRNNFAAKELRHYFDFLQTVITTLMYAVELIKYQHYQVKLEQHEKKINALLSHDLLLFPVAYLGHAITFIKYGDLLAKCDRGANSQLEGTVVIYRMNRPELFTAQFMKNLIYKKQSKHFIESGMNKLLGLTRLVEIPLPAQVTGNCSWANVEATVPTMMFLLFMRNNKEFLAKDVKQAMQAAISFYKLWLEWDKDRALEQCIQSFEPDDVARNASKAAILGAVLFQKCHYHVQKDLERAEKILAVLNTPAYEYVYKDYLKIYHRKGLTPEGDNLKKLLEYCDVAVKE